MADDVGKFVIPRYVENEPCFRIRFGFKSTKFSSSNPLAMGVTSNFDSNAVLASASSNLLIRIFEAILSSSAWSTPAIAI